MLRKITLCFILLQPVGIISGYTQEATSASGSDGKGPGGFASWTVGQVAYTSFTGKGGTASVSTGVQQSYSISIIGTKNAINSINTSWSVYPNPTTDNLILETPILKTGNLTYQLIDMQGVVVKTDLIAGNRTEINTSTLPSSAYFLQIIQGNKKLQSFKIIKN